MHKFGTGYIAECLECATSTVCESTKAEAIEKWNNRADSNNSEKQNISKLTYADVEKMVKPLEWGFRRYEDRGNCEYAYINPTTAFKAVGCLGDCRFIFWDKFGSVIDTFAIVEDGEKDLEVQKQNARKFLVGLVAAALGLERSGE